MTTKSTQLWFILLIAFFLIGCRAEISQEVTLYRNEAWQAEISIKVPVEALVLVGSPQEIEQGLNEAVAEARTLGVQASWKSRSENGSMAYAMSYKGNGLATLGELVFDNSNAFRVSNEGGKRQIEFSHSTGSDFLGASSYTLTLYGGEILNSNGAQINKNTVQWVNPAGRMQATLTEKRRLTIGSLLLLVVALGVVSGGGWYWWQRQQPKVVFCPHCGAQMSSQAVFCPNCGQKR
jgi:hypothetical protein